MMKSRLRRGDRVAVIAGNEKGKSGKVLGQSKGRILVEGLNMRKKHVKKTQDNPKGQILSIEGTMHVSNVSPCDANGRAVKLKVRVGKKGERELVYTDGTKEVIYRSIRKGK